VTNLIWVVVWLESTGFDKLDFHVIISIYLQRDTIQI
jgi:hypothetical protein